MSFNVEFCCQAKPISYSDKKYKNLREKKINAHCARQRNDGGRQSYTYRKLQTIQMKFIILCVWAVLGSTKIALKLKYEI